jgi:hypothetical protein
MPTNSHLLFCAAAAALVLAADNASAQSVRELRDQISAELQAYCADGSTITVGDQALEFRDDGTATVRLWAFDCNWAYQTHPFCGVQACEVRTYRHENGLFVQTGAYLE